MNKDFPDIYVLHALCKQIPGPKGRINILQDIEFKVQKGDSVAVVGASGSGKTTLLHIMGGLDAPSSGHVYFQEQDISALTWQEKADFRNQKIGFVFQFHHLLPEFNTLENVSMPALIAGENKSKAIHKAKEALSLVGLQDQAKQQVSTLSGGERQLAAIARSILQQPEVILADEPTGNLDEKNGKLIGELLLRLNRDLATTLVVVTHNMELASTMHRKVHLRASRIYEDN